ncbi:MAG: sulfatase-like hydrolase/transferase [Myxococcota bacterium]
MALLTGQHAAALDQVEPGPSPEDRVLPDAVATLPEVLQDAGWTTVGVAGNHNYNVDTGLVQGFDRFRDAQKPSYRPSGRTPAARVVAEGLAALDARPDWLAERPFYLQLSFVDAHSPLQRLPELEQELDPDRPNADYRAAIRKIDDAVQQLVDELDARHHEVGVDTLLVVVSEHGEGLGDPPHHGKRHGHVLYETSVAIPWIVVGPGVDPGRGGRWIGGLASQTDLAPTLLDLAGAPALPGPLDGHSWAAQVRGQGDRTDRTRAFSDTWYFTSNRAAIWTDAMACQRDFGSLKQDGDAPFADGCYDRTIDPEFRNLKQDAALLGELEAWRAEVSAAVTERPDAGGEGREAGDEEVEEVEEVEGPPDAPAG